MKEVAISEETQRMKTRKQKVTPKRVSGEVKASRETIED
jgi:hypothetical protein